MSALRRYVRALGTALRHPREFFADHSLAREPAAVLGTVVLVAGVTVVGLALLGSVMAATIDATVLVDNPERPPDWVCEQHGDDPDSLRYESCQESEQVERDVGEVLRSLVLDRLHYGVVGVGLAWVLIAAGLHLGALALGGDGGFGDALTVVAWSLPVEAVRVAVGLAAMWWVLASREFGDGVAALEREVVDAIASVEPVLIGVTLLVTGVQWRVWRGGLEAHHDLSPGAAGAVAGVVAVAVVAVAVT